MRLKYYVLLLVLLIALPSCGGDGKDKVGSLELTTATTALAGGQYKVSAIATYKNPNTTNLVGTEVTFSIGLSGYASQKISLPSGGSEGVIFIVDQIATPLNFFVTASTGSLQDSEVVSIPALGSLVATPTTLTFATTDGVSSAKSVSITGGTAPYAVTSSNATLVTATISGSTVTITRESAGTGNAIVNITDSATTPTTVSVSVTLQ